MIDYSIYTLSYPGPDDVFYVGLTECGLKARLNGHLESSKNGDSLLHNKIKSLGGIPVMTELESIQSESRSYAEASEAQWIRQFVEWGFALCNKVHNPIHTNTKTYNTVRIDMDAIEEVKRAIIGTSHSIGSYFAEAAKESIAAQNQRH
jgi:hypothetical protein